eukprot:scaffold1667_cov173-Amphora_coffeaeformis.AAC.11
MGASDVSFRSELRSSLCILWVIAWAHVIHVEGTSFQERRSLERLVVQFTKHNNPQQGKRILNVVRYAAVGD